MFVKIEFVELSSMIWVKILFSDMRETQFANMS